MFTPHHQGPLGPQGALRAHRPRRRPRRGLHGGHHGPHRHHGQDLRRPLRHRPTRASTSSSSRADGRRRRARRRPRAGRRRRSSTPIRGVDGVDAAAGSIQGFAQLVEADGTVVDRPTASAATIGANWIDDDAPQPVHAGVAATAPAAPTEVVLDQATAERRRAGRSATRSRVLAKDGPARLHHRRHRHATATSTASPARRWSPPTTPPPRSCSPSPAATTPSSSPPPTGVDADRAGRPHRPGASAGSGLEVLTGDADTADKQADVQGRPELLQHAS